MTKQRLVAIPRKQFDFKDMTAIYQPINPLGLGEPCIIVRVVNASNKDVNISYDGVTDHDYLLANHSIQFSSIGTRKAAAKTLVAYVKGSQGVGFIYIIGYIR